jgi:hypothetical protein
MSIDARCILSVRTGHRRRRGLLSIQSSGAMVGVNEQDVVGLP